MSKEVFADGYVDAVIFAEWPEGLQQGNFDDASQAKLLEIAYNFYDANADDIEAYCEGVTQAGHDLLFSQNGHGCGFWENDDDVSKRLQLAAKKVDTMYLYLGDYGLVHVA